MSISILEYAVSTQYGQAVIVFQDEKTATVIWGRNVGMIHAPNHVPVAFMAGRRAMAQITVVRDADTEGWHSREADVKPVSDRWYEVSNGQISSLRTEAVRVANAWELNHKTVIPRIKLTSIDKKLALVDQNLETVDNERRKLVALKSKLWENRVSALNAIMETV